VTAKQAGAIVSSWLASARRHRALQVALLSLAAAAFLAIPLRAPPVAQPVAFNHRKHTKDLKLDCRFCHQYVMAGAHAGLPDAKVCVMCHQVRQGQSVEAARVTELLHRGDSLRFAKLFRLPAHVNFTHRRHVAIAKLACENCHGAIADAQRPPERSLVTIRMAFCIACHRAKGQTVDCIACHR
jgi:hypothetical protein